MPTFFTRSRLHTGRKAALVPRVVDHVRREHEALKDLEDVRLVLVANELRERVSGGESATNPLVLARAFALMIEALRRETGKTLYDVQIQGGLALALGRIAQMRTGEGKTLTGALPALVHSLRGRGVHVATSNCYLAERDCELMAPAFRRLGVTCSMLPEKVGTDVKRLAYDSDITYGTGQEFGFDYLRDQTKLLEERRRPLGATFREQLSGPNWRRRSTAQRGLAFTIIDEADHVMLDDATSPLVIAVAPPGEAEDAVAHEEARRLALQLEPARDYVLTLATGMLRLTPVGEERIHADLSRVPMCVLARPWSQYVENSLRAEHVMRRDVHYVVAEDEVQIVDETTGRIMPDRTWRDGLHQAIELKEGLAPSPDQYSLATITRQRFYRLYEGCCGMTGTAEGSEAEFRDVYRLQVEVIPPRLPCLRKILPSRFFVTSNDKWDAIRNDVLRLHATGRPILIGTRAIADSEFLAQKLRESAIPHALLNGRQDAAEADLIAGSGRLGAVTIATNIAGRGTDIIPAPESLALGGLHVIACEPHESGRVDRQLIGRGARQGQPGSAQLFVSTEDALLKDHAPWLAAEVRRLAGSADEVATTGTLDQLLKQAQARAEHAAATQRGQILASEKHRDQMAARFLRGRS